MAFGRLLGLSAPGSAAAGQLALTSVAWVKDHVELGLTAAGGPVVAAVVERRHQGADGLAQTKDLNVWLRGDGLGERGIGLLRRAVRDRLAGVTVDQLALLLAADRELGAVRYEPPAAVAQAREQEFERQAFLFNWGGEDMWYQFFATAEIARARLESLDLLNHATSVNHCDRECLANEPHIPLRVPQTNFPWDDRIRALATRRPRAQAGGVARDDSGEGVGGPADPGIPAHYTELTDRDVIVGGQSKLAQVLDHAIAHLHGDMIFAHVTCIPAVTGEDVDAVIRRAQEKSPVPILTLTMTPDAKDVIFGPILVQKRKLAEDRLAGQPPDPRAVNLIGFPEDAGTAELEGLLAELGVRVNEVLLPTVQLERVERLPKAGLHVIQPNGFWDNLYNQLLLDSRIRSVSPEAPYGPARTRAWLAAVLAALGLPAEPAHALFAVRWEPLRERWEELVREAEKHSLAFVLGAEQVHQLATPGATWGIPLLGFLEECGFTLEFLVRAADAAAGRLAAGEILGTLRDPGRHAGRPFTSAAQLSELLGDGTFSAVYSEHFFDFRLSRSGKAQFSLNLLERGLQGAVRSLERLLEVCRFPLYRRYGRFLGPAFPWKVAERAGSGAAEAASRGAREEGRP